MQKLTDRAPAFWFPLAALNCKVLISHMTVILSICCCSAVQKLNRVKPLSGCQTCPVEVGSLDLASMESVKAFAAKFNARSLPLALLICNAGVMAPPKRLETQDGCEQQFQVECCWLHRNMLGRCKLMPAASLLSAVLPHTCNLMHTLGIRLASMQCVKCALLPWSSDDFCCMPC